MLILNKESINKKMNTIHYMPSLKILNSFEEQMTKEEV